MSIFACKTLMITEGTGSFGKVVIIDELNSNNASSFNLNETKAKIAVLEYMHDELK